MGRASVQKMCSSRGHGLNFFCLFISYGELMVCCHFSTLFCVDWLAVAHNLHAGYVTPQANVFAHLQEANFHPAGGTSSFSSSTPKDRSHKWTHFARNSWLLWPFPYQSCLPFLLFYNGKVINSWTLAKRDLALCYLWSLSLITYPTHSIVSFLPLQ